MTLRRAVLTRSQLVAHRRWLRLGAGERPFDLSGLRYEAQTAVGWTFERARIAGCHFVRCNLSSANLRGAWIADSRFEGGSLEMAKLHGATVERCRFDDVGAIGMFVDGARFVECDFSGGTLATVTWRDARLERCRFEGTVLRKSRLAGLEVVECAFVGCDFSGTAWDGIGPTGAAFARCTGAPDRPPGFFGLWRIADDGGARVVIGERRIDGDVGWLRLAVESARVDERGRLRMHGEHAGEIVHVVLTLEGDGVASLEWSDGVTFPATVELTR